MEDITVRVAQAADAEVLCRMNGEFNGPGLTSAAFIRKMLESASGEIVVLAMCGLEPVGFCCMQVTRSVCYNEAGAELTELYVREPYRRRGCAAQLVRFAERVCKEAYRVESVRLLTGRGNSAAQKLYVSLGYTPQNEVLYVKSI